MYKKIVLSLLPLSIFANNFDLSEINKQIISQDRPQFVLDNLTEIKEKILENRIKELKNKIKFENEDKSFLENMLKVNLEKVNALISQKKYNEAYILHSNLEYSNMNEKNLLDNFFEVINNNDFKKLTLLNNNYISISLNFFFNNLNTKNYSLQEIESLKANVLLISNNNLSKDDKYRFFRDISLLSSNFVEAYNYSFNIKNDTFVDNDIKASIKNILLLQEEVFIKYYLQTNKETIMNINKEGLK
jgi:hypothetical protein